MHLVHLHLSRSDQIDPSDADVHQVYDALWAHKAPSAGLEHIWARAGSAGIDLILFLSNDIRDPVHYADALITSISEASPVLRTWRVSTHR